MPQHSTPAMRDPRTGRFVTRAASIPPARTSLSATERQDDTSAQMRGQVRLMGAAILATGRHMYEGTANPKAVQRRRAASKVARKSRQANR